MKFLIFFSTITFAFALQDFQYNKWVNKAVMKYLKSIKEKILIENRETIKLPDLYLPLELRGKLSFEKGKLKGFSNFELHANTSLVLPFMAVIGVPIIFSELKFTYNYNANHSKSNESGQVTVNIADAYNEFIINACKEKKLFLYFSKNQDRRVGSIDISYSGKKPGKFVSEALEDAFRTKIVGFAWKKLEIEIQAIMDDMNKWIAQNPEKSENILKEIMVEHKRP